MSKLNDELKAECERSEPHKEIPVIITINDWSRRSELEASGLRVDHSFENILAVAGTLTCAQVSSVAALDHVERIEFDGEVRAIQKEDPKVT